MRLCCTVVDFVCVLWPGLSLVHEGKLLGLDCESWMSTYDDVFGVLRKLSPARRFSRV
jgi:hypothetical protein